jgi:hypothetical protein
VYLNVWYLAVLPRIVKNSGEVKCVVRYNVYMTLGTLELTFKLKVLRKISWVYDLHDFGKFKINHINVILFVYFQINIFYARYTNSNTLYTLSCYCCFQFHHGKSNRQLRCWWLLPVLKFKLPNHRPFWLSNHGF